MAIAGKESENGVYEFPYMIKPPQRTKWEAVKLFFWNPSTGEFFGRTSKSWGQIVLFYLIFYTALAALFAICLAGLYATIDKDKPSYTDIRSLIGSNPGLGFRPIADRTSEGALIWYNPKNQSTVDKWVSLINEFLEEYKMDRKGRNTTFQSGCSFDRPPAEGRACEVETDKFGPCSAFHDFGYKSASPCVFLKLNKIYNWVPEYYNTSEHLPKEMPDDLKSEINKSIAEKEGNQVWVSCKGEYSADKDHVKTFKYYPTRGFPGYYYPFKHKKGTYLNPLIAVQIENPTPGVIINIECRAWAKNIIYIGGPPEQRKGSVHFEIMRDDN